MRASGSIFLDAESDAEMEELGLRRERERCREDMAQVVSCRAILVLFKSMLEIWGTYHPQSGSFLGYPRAGRGPRLDPL